jgi:hypothetical protein
MGSCEGESWSGELELRVGESMTAVMNEEKKNDEYEI